MVLTTALLVFTLHNWCFSAAKIFLFHRGLIIALGTGTPPCGGRTPVDDAPAQMYDMLGEPIIPQEQRVATPPIHGVNIVGTINSAPVADLISTQNSKPATVSCAPFSSDNYSTLARANERSPYCWNHKPR